MEKLRTTNNTTATRIVASTFGILVGLAGIEHGFFEILQGNVKPGSLLFEAIGPAQRFWEYGTEHALTIVPNLLVTGILAMLIGLLVVIWAARFVDNKYGAGSCCCSRSCCSWWAEAFHRCSWRSWRRRPRPGSTSR